jgi:hypothetical protein
MTTILSVREAPSKKPKAGAPAIGKTTLYRKLKQYEVGRPQGLNFGCASPASKMRPCAEYLIQL